MKNILTTALILFVIFGGSSQERKLDFNLSIGFLLNHYELGTSNVELAPGTHLSLNIYNRKEKKLKSEFQFSMNASGRGGSNMSGSFFSTNLLYGLRYYLTQPDKNYQFYINSLIGPSYVNESGDDFTDNFFSFGYSLGAHTYFNKVSIGLAAESYNNFIFKLGYTF